MPNRSVCFETATQFLSVFRPVLGVFLPELASGFMATTSTSSGLHLWRLPPEVSESFPGPAREGGLAESRSSSQCLVARAESPNPSRIFAITFCPRLGLLVCGDQAGNVFAFLAPSLIFDRSFLPGIPSFFPDSHRPNILASQGKVARCFSR